MNKFSKLRIRYSLTIINCSKTLISTNKNSMRSTNLVDLNNLPAKDRDFKEYKSLYPKHQLNGQNKR